MKYNIYTFVVSAMMLSVLPSSATAQPETCKYSKARYEQLQNWKEKGGNAHTYKKFAKTCSDSNLDFKFAIEAGEENSYCQGDAGIAMAVVRTTLKHLTKKCKAGTEFAGKIAALDIRATGTNSVSIDGDTLVVETALNNMGNAKDIESALDNMLN